MLDYIIENLDKKTYQEIADALGVSKRSVEYQAKKAGLVKKAVAKKSTEQVNEELEELGSSFVLTEEYTTASAKLLFKCKLCGNEVARTTKYLRTSPICKCSKVKLDSTAITYISDNIDKLTYVDMAKVLGVSAEAVRAAASRNSIQKTIRLNQRNKDSYNEELLILGSSYELLDEFVDVSTKALHKCKLCNTEVYKTPQQVLQHPQCSCTSHKVAGYTLDRLLRELPSGISYVAGFSNYSTNCTFKCLECSHVWEAKPTKIVHNVSGCPQCAVNGRTLSLQEVKQRSSEYGLEFLDDVYLNAHAYYNFRNITCGHTFKYKFNYIQPNTCRVCAEANSTSAPEREIVSFIESLGFSTSKGKLSDGKEIDIIINGTDVGIEFNGNYWHSDMVRPDSNYHLNKSNLFQGRLIHIFEFMWNSKKDIIKSMIKHSLNISDYIYYARECIIKEVSSQDARTFLDTNHIQGFLSANKYIGLYNYNDELVSIMTFNKSRFSKLYEYEIGRYAVSQNSSVVGGASKLFKYFVKIYKPKSIVSYCHRFYSTGNLYEKLGMELTSISKPGYWYLHPDNITVSSRQKFQKHKLKDILPVFDQNLTEAENMANNGYTKIYDCGNLVFTWVA